MLRTLQTQTLSNKVVKLFDTLALKANLQARPALIEVRNASNNRDFSGSAPLTQARRRRQRRSRVASSAGHVRSSWF